MFETILSVLYVIGTIYFDTLWFTVIGGVILLILIGPGLYATVFGAPYMRSSDKRIDGILKLGDFKKGDRVVDLGCGDGKVMNAIHKSGIDNVIGYEYSIPTYLLALFRFGPGKVRFGNFWKKDFSNADVLVCFLLERTMGDFEKKIWPNLASGTRVISNEFVMEGVEADDSDGRVYLYVKK